MFPPKNSGPWRVLLIAFSAVALSVVAAADGMAAEEAGAPLPTEADTVAPSAKNTCAPGTGERVAAIVQARYDGIRDLATEFEQQSQSATFAGTPLMDADTKSGHVVFAKPGKMRWTYSDPDPSVVVSDGKTLWIHDVAGETVTRLEVTAGYLSGAALQFLLGDGQILEDFSVEATACAVDRVTLDLVPKTDATYERLGLEAHPETGDIMATSVVDLFGNRTSIRFVEITPNQSPPASTFAFEVPEGVELIDYSALPAP